MSALGPAKALNAMSDGPKPHGLGRVHPRVPSLDVLLKLTGRAAITAR